MRTERLDEAQSIVVTAPAAAAILRSPLAPVDEKELLREENASLRQELNQARVAMRSLASIAVALARMAHDEDGPLDRELVIPRELYDKLEGCEVGVAEDADKNLTVRIRDNVKHPVWEGR